MKSIIIILLMFCFVCSCNKIKDGRITFIGFVPPHEETYGCGYYMGKVYIPRTCYRWVGDTTWYITFRKVKGKDTATRDIVVSKYDAYKYNIGDYIELADN